MAAKKTVAAEPLHPALDDVRAGTTPEQNHREMNDPKADGREVVEAQESGASLTITPPDPAPIVAFDPN